MRSYKEFKGKCIAFCIILILLYFIILLGVTFWNLGEISKGPILSWRTVYLVGIYVGIVVLSTIVLLIIIAILLMYAECSRWNVLSKR